MISFYAKVGKRVFQVDDPFFKFSGGEIHMNSEPEMWEGKWIAVVQGSNLDDYMKLAQWSQVVDHQGGTVDAFIPYLPAARADKGYPRGADFYADLISLASLTNIYCLDPHSPYMVEGLRARGFTVFDWKLSEFLNPDDIPNKYDAVIAPDQGAVDRAEEMAALMGIQKVITCTKKREFDSGNITKLEIPKSALEFTYALVADDICDGGKTFEVLYDTIAKERGESPAMDLYVTHGLFSKGTAELKKRYMQLYHTDSVTQKAFSDPFDSKPGKQISVIQRLLPFI